MTATTPTKPKTKNYGVHSEVGKLHKVMVCSPGLAHSRLTPSNCDDLLFDDVLWVDMARRDHHDFVLKMRDRGIDVIEMHQALAETLDVPEAKKWILDQQIVPNEVGPGLVDEVRSYLDGLSSTELAKYLIGGLAPYDFPKTLPGNCSKSPSEASGHHSAILLPPLPNPSYTRRTKTQKPWLDLWVESTPLNPWGFWWPGFCLPAESGPYLTTSI